MNGRSRVPLRVRQASRLLEAAIVLGVTQAVVFTSPRRLTAVLLRRASEGRAVGSPVCADRVRAVARTIDRIAPLVPGVTCLGRALTGWVMLERRGVPSVVRIGAHCTNARIRMHAWLEVGGTPLIGGEQAMESVPLTSLR